MSPYRSGVAILQRTGSSAKLLAQKMGNLSTVVPPKPCAPPDIQMKLSTPRMLAPQLAVLGVDDFAARRICMIVTELSSRLKHQTEAHVKHMLDNHGGYFQDSKYSILIPATYSAIYAKTVDTWITYLLNDVLPRVLKVQITRKKSTAHAISGRTSKRPFNQAAVPVLERFFEQNAFPSRLEKFELASQCDMDYRQIHVWFQNRRSRSRKDGKEPKQPEQPTNFMKELEASIVETLLPAESEDDESDPVEDRQVLITSVAAAERNPLSSVDVPSHAFPAPYPPLCPEDPFPLQAGQRSFPTPWLRRPCAEAPSRDTLEVSDLIAAFQGISLSDTTTQEEQTSTLRAPQLSPPPPFGFITPCTRAPHPALIWDYGCSQSPCVARCIASSPPIRSASISAYRCSSKRVQHFPSPAIDAPSTSSQTNVSLCRRQKKRGLPRRVPRNPLPRAQLSTALISTGSLPTLVPSTGSSPSISDETHSDIESPLSTPPLLPNSLSCSPSLSIMPSLSLKADLGDSTPLQYGVRWPWVVSDWQGAQYPYPDTDQYLPTCLASS